MKSNNRVLFFQWLGIGALITIACIALGLYITHFLTQKEELHQRQLRNEGQIHGPMRERIELMRSLIASGRTTPEEAFRMIDRAQNAPFPEATYLLDENKKVIDSHLSESFNKNLKIPSDEFKLSETRYYRISFERPKRSPLFSPPGPGRRGPQREVFFIVFFAIGVSVIIGLGISLIALNLYLRKRAREASEVINKIRHGDLSARFKIGQADDAGALMGRFNEMAEEIELLVNNLKSTEESRKKMLQELAHDLRTPVASIKNLQETLFQHENALSEADKGQLQTLAMREVNYFERLVEDLLFLSGVNDPKYKQTLRKVNLKNIIEEELALIEMTHLSTHVKISEEIIISADEHLLHRLFRNAFSNSMRFAKSKISVLSEIDDQKIIISIIDDGPGLKPSDMTDFGEKKFSRNIQENEGNHISIGLGSVIMKKIMILHRGDLRIENVEKGAQLTLIFSRT